MPSWGHGDHSGGGVLPRTSRANSEGVGVRCRGADARVRYWAPARVAQESPCTSSGDPLMSGTQPETDHTPARGRTTGARLSLVAPEALRILPIQLQVGNCFTHEEGEWKLAEQSLQHPPAQARPRH